MKIQSIHIYGFGQFENKKITIDPNQALTVFYGANESGKSTMIAFLHAMFFGFPNKNQTDHHYEPKIGGKYGGNVTVLTDDHQIVTIERVARRTPSELLLYDEKGKSIEKKQLNEIVKGLDRSLYQAIFSFGFQGLQDIKKIKSTDLSHYLFSVGASGSEALLNFDKTIQKTLEELYKPSGKKPVLNKQLTELEHMKKQLQKWDEKLDTYNQLVEKKNHLLEETKQLDNHIKETLLLLKEYEKKQMLLPYVEEHKRWKTALAQMEVVCDFPEDGLLRLQQLQHELRPLIAQKNLHEQKMRELQQEMQSIHIQRTILHLEPKIRALLEKQKVVELQEAESEKIRHSLQNEEMEIETLLEKLGRSFDEQIIQKIDTSIGTKEKLKELMAQKDRLSEEKSFLDEQFQVAKHELEIAEATVAHSKKQFSNKRFYWQYILSILLFMIGLLLIIGYDQWYPFFILAAISVGLSIEKILQQKKKASVLEKEKLFVKQKEDVFDVIVKKFEKWELKSMEWQDAFNSFCFQHQLPTNLSSSYILDVFEWIEQLKKHVRRKNQLNKEYERIKETIMSFYQERKEVLNEFAENDGLNFSHLHQLLQRIEEEKKKEQRIQQLQEILAEYRENHAYVEQQLSYIQKEINDLFSSVNVKDEDEFRKKGHAYERYKTAKEKVQSIENHFHSVLRQDERNYVEEIKVENLPYNQLMKSLTAELANYREEVKVKQMQIADLTVELRNLEEGTTYSELFHRYEQKKSEFQKTAEQWAVYKVAKDLMDKTKEYYQQVRLPKVVAIAEKYFSFLTFHSYPRIFAPTDDRGFIVERQDGMRFDSSELSQATAEQLYLSLRFALVTNFMSTVQLPILIDDSFVNFDLQRTNRVIQLLKEMSQKQQILFFTCHKHMIESFPKEIVHFL